MQNPYSMEDRRIIVTGAAQGIGRAVRRSLPCRWAGASPPSISMAMALKTLGDELGDSVMTFTGSVTDQGPD